ncbi:hypothetical protein [Parafrankia sp. FMc2]|uniref:hypothetical protein n=1 Tax=Parafrankia sp. FMc2 TaxID=3233196 RepID=UPI0034D57DA6
MTPSCPEADDLSPTPAPPAPPATEPGFTIRQSYTDGSVRLAADLGVSAGRLVDRIAVYTPIAAVLTDAVVEGGRLLLTFSRPA